MVSEMPWGWVGARVRDWHAVAVAVGPASSLSLAIRLDLWRGRGRAVVVRFYRSWFLL